jgi:hypothetical protein
LIGAAFLIPEDLRAPRASESIVCAHTERSIY